MIPFHGRAAEKQFIKEKPNPRGLNIFISGAPDSLPLYFFMYQGAGEKINTSTNDNDAKYLDTGGKVVLILSENLPPGCTLYMDRYFT